MRSTVEVRVDDLERDQHFGNGAMPTRLVERGEQRYGRFAHAVGIEAFARRRALARLLNHRGTIPCHYESLRRKKCNGRHDKRVRINATTPHCSVRARRTHVSRGRRVAKKASEPDGDLGEYGYQSRAHAHLASVFLEPDGDGFATTGA